MSETLTCKTCGSAFKAGAFGGKCPRCMMGVASFGSRLGSFEVLPAEELNESLPEFEIHELVGRGGMGAVYRARQLDLDREVAIKLLSSDAGADPEFAERFSREAQVTAKLDHPGIVPVYGVGYDSLGRCYYTMRMVRGRELGEIFRSWSLARSVAVIVRVCQAMAFAHGKGVVHRDLKPSNIMVGDLGEVYIMDWGLAKTTGGAGERDIRLARDISGDSPLMTMDGAVVGTPAYMPPEQALSRVDEVDHLSDIYSLGALLYELLAGHAPYSPTGSKSTPAQVLETLTVQPPERVRGENTKAPTELVAVCEKAMSRAKSARYQSAIALADDLQAWLDGRVVAAHGTGALITARKWVGRNRALALATMVLTVLGLGAVIFVQFFANREVSSALEKEHAAKTDALATLAESHVSAGMQADSPAKAALFFDRAAAIAPDPEARLANRIRTKEWSHANTRIVRSFMVDGNPNFLDLHPSGRFLSVQTELPTIFDVAAEKPIDLVPGAKLLSASWSPDGKLLAVTTDAETALLLYDLPALTLRSKLPTLTRSCGPIVFSEDSSLVAVGVAQCHVWSVNDGRLLCFAKAEPGKSRRPICISPDHTRILILCDDKELCLFPIQSDGGSVDPVAAPFLHRASEVYSHLAPPAFLPRTAQFIHTRKSEKPNGYIELVWRDSTTGAELKSLPGFTDFGGLSPDGATFAGRNVEFIGTFDSNSGEPRTRVDYIGAIKDVRFSPDGNRLIFAGSDTASVPVFSTLDGKKVDDLAMQRNGAKLAAYTANGAFAATAQECGLIQIFSHSPPDPLPGRVISLDVTSLPALGQTALPVIHPGGKLVALGGCALGNDEVVPERNTRSRVLEIATGEPVGPILDPGGYVLYAEFTPDGDTLALLATAGTTKRTGTQFLPDGKAGNLQLWDWKTGTRHGEPIPMPSEPRCVVFRSGKAYVWCGGGQVLEVDLATRRVSLLFQTKEWQPVYWANYGRIAFSPDGDALFAWQQGDKVIAWDLAAARHRFPPVKTGSACGDLAFLPATATSPGVFATVEFFAEIAQLRFFATLTGQPTAKPIPLGTDASRCHFSPDGRRILITTTQAQAARLYDWRTGTATCPEVRHPNSVYSAAFIPGTSWCISGDQDGIIQLWDGNTGKLIIPSGPRGGGIYDIKVTPDGHHALYSPQGSGELRILDLAALRSDFPLSPEGQRLLCELNAAAIAHPNGGTVTLDATEWYQRWVKLRSQHPDFHRFPN